jgi:hypothetical protein
LVSGRVEEKAKDIFENLTPLPLCTYRPKNRLRTALNSFATSVITKNPALINLDCANDSPDDGSA